MGSAPYGLSVHNFISSVGADAGFASIIGLAILVLLYFAHARETSALREQAAMLADRLQDAEARLAEAARSGMPIVVSRRTAAEVGAPSPAASPGAPATAAAGPASAVAVAAPPGAPAGVGAPALAAATRFVPLLATAGTPAAASPAEASPAQAAPAPAPPAQPAPAQAASAPVPAPATAAAAMSASAPFSAPAAAPPPPSQPSPSTPGAGAANGAGQTQPRPMPAAATRAASAPAPTSRGGERRPYPPLTPPTRERSSTGRVVAALIGILVLGGAVAALLVATSGNGTQNKLASTPTTNAPSSSHHGTASFNPAKVTVAVLNGTAVNRLAARVSQRLTSDGYKPGHVTDASDQTMTSTAVAYLSGDRTDAMHVATSLRLPASSVKPIDPSTLSVACGGSSTCAANVVVTVGADLANS